MIAIKLILFVISSLGSWELIRRNTRIHVYFLPSLVIAIQTTVLFCAGLVNLLYMGMLLLYIIGILGFIFSLYKDRSFLFIKEYLKIGFVFMIVVLIIMFVFVNGKIFTHYDNFSHWALVVKKMIEVNRYPNLEDTIIVFQEYPLGSATYIYYFSKLITTSESMQMLAQIYMMLASIIPLFIFAKRNKGSAFILMLVATNFFFVYNITVTNLLVDTLLPLVAMCGLLFSFLYCKKSSRTLEILLTSFYLIQILQIKNSGIFFVILICLWILRNLIGKNNGIARLICIALPFISLQLWKMHCNIVFDNAALTKHAMTVQNYQNVFDSKTMEEINNICAAMVKFAITWKDVWMACFILFLLGLLIYKYSKSQRKPFANFCMFACIMYIVYELGILAMYLFSMPTNEASSLAGNTRYTKTILIAILYLAMIFAIKLISSLSNQRKHERILIISTLIFSYALYMQVSQGHITTAIQYTENSDERDWIEAAKIEFNVPNGSSYCFLIPENDFGYSLYMGKYIFQANSVTYKIINDLESMDSIQTKYIFVYDHKNAIINEWIQKNYPEQYGNKVIIKEDILQ